MSADEPITESAETRGNKMLAHWNALIRRARIGRQLKHAALTVSSYANNDGTSVRCGVARLAADCEIGYSTARRYLAWLREVGLIELVQAGSRKAKRADVYRLVIAPAAYEQLEIPDEAEYKKIVDGMNVANQTSQKARRLRDQRSPKESANATESAEDSALAIESANGGYQRSFPGSSALTQDEPPPLSDTSQKKAPPTGGAPPPDPRRPEPPTASGSRLEARRSLNPAPTQAQDQASYPLPHARGPSGIERGGLVVDFFTREVS